MMCFSRTNAVLLAATLSSPGCRARDETQVIHISAAISLKDPLEEMARSFEASHPRTKISIALGASGDLEQQIEHGAPADLFASAAEAPAMRLVEAGRAESSCVLASNSLVLIHRSDPALASLSWTTLATTPAMVHLALGLSPSVPAGTYAEEALRRLGILAALDGKIVRGANVRHVLDLVAR